MCTNHSTTETDQTVDVASIDNANSSYLPDEFTTVGNLVENKTLVNTRMNTPMRERPLKGHLNKKLSVGGFRLHCCNFLFYFQRFYLEILV